MIIYLPIGGVCMKKWFLILTLIIAVLLSSCSTKNQDIYDVQYREKDLIVDTVDKTISYDGQLYKYEVSGTTTTIIYPNNAKYWWTQTGNVGYGGWSEDYDEVKYISGSELVSVLSNESDSKSSNKNYILIIIFLILGVWSTASPHSSWYLSYGWRYKNAEPSEIALILTRISGIILILASIVYIFI
jgi:hypothetical protein